MKTTFSIAMIALLALNGAALARGGANGGSGGGQGAGNGSDRVHIRSVQISTDKREARDGGSSSGGTGVSSNMNQLWGDYYLH